MNFKKISLYSLVSVSLALWTGCTVKHADSEIAMPDEEEEIPQELTAAEQELVENHQLLHFFFLNANQKLGDINSYNGHGEDAGYSPDYYEFPDVYYMYSQMDDNYTRYFGPYYVSKYDLDMASEPIYSIAVSVQPADSQLVITQVYPNGPGDKAGLKAGDTVLYVGSTKPGDEKSFEKLTSGSEGDSISFKILRGSDTLDISAELFCYLEPTVHISYHDSVPVIKITSFENFSGISCNEANSASEDSTKGTSDEVKAALQATKGSAIIDLRGNPGGAFDACVKATELFLSKGDTIGTLEYTEVAPDEVHQMVISDRIVATEDGIAKGRYFVFMADTNSASCSETMLMGVTNTTQSPIVGMLTYGKGIGQYNIPTGAGGLSMITAMKLYDKNDVSYHDKGIEPDYAISDTLKALDKAVEIAKLGKEKRTKGYGTEKQGHFENTLAKKAFSSKEPARGGAYKVIKNPLMK